MRKLSDLSEETRENILAQLTDLFDDVDSIFENGQEFLAPKLMDIADRYGLDETELLEFYKKNNGI